MITIFKDIKDVNNPHYVTLEKIVNRIETGTSINLINAIRSEPDKDERNKLKSQLPSICFSGQFSRRANNACLKHSGLICCDFDHVQDIKELKNSLIKDKYTCCVFVSPSGDGLKLIVKIPANIDTHKSSCLALKDYYKNDSFDLLSDLARVCYESYDPEIYCNPNSETFPDLITEEKVKVEKNEIIKDDYEIFLKLKKWIEEIETYTQGNRQKFIVKFAGALNRYGVYRVNALSYLKNTYQNLAGKFEAFDSIVDYVYNRYSNQNNISFFDHTGYSFEYQTKQRTSKDFFKDYQIESEPGNKEIIELYNKAKIDLNCQPPQMPAYLKVRKSKNELRNVRLFTAGNISAVKGKAKSKKTFFISLVTGCLVSNNQVYNCLYPSLTELKNKIVLIDTEQSRFDTYTVSNRIKNLAPENFYNGNNENFIPLCCRGYDSNQIIKLISYLVSIYPTIAIIIIDQIADLAKSVNDEKEAIALLKFFEKLTIDNNIHVCCIIHENPLSEKATGWLGSQILKKAETILTVSKDAENKRISHISATMTRGEDFEDFSIYIDNNGMPSIINDVSSITDNDFINNQTEEIPF